MVLLAIVIDALSAQPTITEGLWPLRARLLCLATGSWDIAALAGP